MKSLFRRPRFGLMSPALWAMAIGILGTSVVAAGGLHPLVLIVSIPYLTAGLMIWQEQRWAVWTGFALFSLSALLRAVGLVVNFQWRHVVYLLAFVVVAYECWQGLRQLKEADDADDDEKDEPMISFVLLQRTPKYLDDVILPKIVEAAWGGDFSSEDKDLVDGFVVGENPLFVIQSPHGTYLVHNQDQQYWDQTEDVVEEITELRLRKAVADHHAWLAVDLISSSVENAEPADFYPRVIQLIMELADEDTLVILRPDTMDINVWSDELAEQMTAPNAHEEFARQYNAPVVAISDDEPHIQSAIETAQRRWPEFVEAFHQQDAADGEFHVKAKITVNDETEFIWIDVIGLEPKYVHGRLANDPVDLGELKLGSQVEVPLEDVHDWCYLHQGERIGLFSLEAIAKSQQG